MPGLAQTERLHTGVFGWHSIVFSFFASHVMRPMLSAAIEGGPPPVDDGKAARAAVPQAHPGRRSQRTEQCR